MGNKDPAYNDFSLDTGNLRNVYNLWNKKPYETVSPLPVLPVQLIETLPGDFIVYGVGSPNAYLLCFCLGTVGFSAKAGEITDVGTFMTDRADLPSILPELASETNIGVTAAGDFPLTAGAIRPYRVGDRMPPSIVGLPRNEARFFCGWPLSRSASAEHQSACRHTRNPVLRSWASHRCSKRQNCPAAIKW